jgi:hypothetical protein
MSSKYFSMVGDVVSCGEPIAFQHEKDIMQVVTPSSFIVQKIFFLRCRTVICNARWCERNGSLFYVSKQIMLDSKGLITPMDVIKAFRCEGKVYRTWSAHMAHGAWERYSTML